MQFSPRFEITISALIYMNVLNSCKDAFDTLIFYRTEFCSFQNKFCFFLNLSYKFVDLVKCCETLSTMKAETMFVLHSCVSRTQFLCLNERIEGSINVERMKGRHSASEFGEDL